MINQDEIITALKEGCDMILDAIRLIEKGDGPAAGNMIILAIGRLEAALDLLPPSDKLDPGYRDR